MLTFTHIFSIICTLLVVTYLGLYSIKQVKSASDFALGGRTIGTGLVAGIIAGTLVGGASTVGTAQLAFEYGFSAWWFTLGGGIGCIILGLLLAKPLRQSGASTGPGYLGQIYGDKARILASIFSSLGIFLNIVGQILAAIALLTSMFNITPLGAAFFAVLMVITYVIFGGVWSTGLVGSLKVVLIYISLITAGYLSYRLGGGIQGLRTSLGPYPWFSLFGRGISTDLAAGFSLIVGVISTQTYLQAIFSGRDVKASRNGAIISGLIFPPIGLAGILVGLYMRANFPLIHPSEALPLFVLQFLPPWLGGIVIATLLVSAIGTGAGLVLGVSTMLTQDIYKNILVPNASDKSILLFSRLSVVFVSMLTLIFVTGNLNSLILKWSFLSMGLRGATIFFPLLFAIFCKDFVKPLGGILAIALAPLASITWALWGTTSLDPLYVGLTISLVILIIYSFPRK